MKIKDDILRWREEMRKMTAAINQLDKKTEDYAADIKELKGMVAGLAKITEEMTETMLTLIRQQIGD